MNLSESFQTSESTDYLNDGEQISYKLDDEEIEYAKSWAAKRHGSYDSGATRDEDWGDSSLPSMERGVAVELVLALLYDDCEFDTYVGADGDGGSDGQIEIDGVLYDFDVKSNTTLQADVPFDVELLFAKHHIDERDVPPVLVSAYVSKDMRTVRIRGFVRTEEFLDSATIKPAYAGSHTNYALSVDELSAMPVPSSDQVELGDDYQVC